MIHLYLCIERAPASLGEHIALNMSSNIYEVCQNHPCVSGITVGRSMDELLAIARTDPYQYGLFIKSGVFFYSRFLFMMNDAAAEGVYLAGHILDQTEWSEYFTLHDQTFLLNLEKFRTTKDIAYTSVPGMKRQIIRSPENFHDGYTPIWIERGAGLVDVKRPALGADLISSGLDLGPVRPFRVHERDSKFFTYPDTDFEYNSTKIEANIAQIEDFYLINSDTLDPALAMLPKLSALVIPAAGLQPFRIAYETGITDDFKMIVYDHSKFARSMFTHIIKHWDGKDLTDLHRYGRPTLSLPKGVDLVSEWEQFVSHFGSQAEWLEFFNFVKRRTVVLPADLIRRDLVDLAEPLIENETTPLFWISNIFMYERTSFFRSYEVRHRYFMRQFTRLKQRYPHGYLQYCMANRPQLVQLGLHVPEKLEIPWEQSNFFQ